MACSRPTPSCVQRSFRAGRLTRMTLQTITATRPITRYRPASAGPGGIRVFAIDSEQCPQCGSPLTIIAAIEDPTVMAKILTHLGLSIRAPPRATFAVIRSTPNGLIPIDTRFNPVQPLSRQSLLTFTRARRQIASTFDIEGRSMARKVPDSRPRTRVFDNSTHPAVLFSSTKKGVYFSYTLPVARGRL
jgi:hypothetical protein